MKFKKIKIKSTEMRQAESQLKKINSFRRKFKVFSDEELKMKTEVFRRKLKMGVSTNKFRAEAFAVVREATSRVLNKVPFDVQMLGGVILDMGNVAEMKTGEGKTIASIAPVYLNALSGEGVIVSTVNEYLSQRDAEEMGEVFKWLGLTVGLNKTRMPEQLKREAYNCDITYSVHSELGFDYLRDNMVSTMDQKVQRKLNYILIDEVDSILIDESKTPLIISGGEGEKTEMYQSVDQFIRTLETDDFEIDEETKAVSLTEVGIDQANKFFKFENLYNIQHSELVHRLQNALRAHKVMKCDVEYVVLDGKIKLVDSFTGRIMEGRAYSEGLQQALQAKELIEIEPETKTMATITYQNFFRLFKKICGMTGTAKTEEQEFIDIYNMRVTEIPTNKPLIRIDEQDEIFVNFKSKYQAIVQEIKTVNKTGQPILIGTSQVEQSEYLHKLLSKANLKHTVLNAKQNKDEAKIISNAGKLNAITIATNMAGRGTDIKLTDEVVNLGGLYVLGTDKAEARRIDNQLKGRSGRQGDPGRSKFYLSLDDQLILRFSAQETLKKQYSKFNKKIISDNSIQTIFKKAQKRIEGFNFDNRKTVLNYDDVIRQQRDLIYSQRDLILTSDDLTNIIFPMINNVIDQLLNFDEFYNRAGNLKYENIITYINEKFFKISKNFLELKNLVNASKEELPQVLDNKMTNAYKNIRKRVARNFSKVLLQQTEKDAILNNLDTNWQEQINIMDKLRSNVSLHQYAQKNPFQIFTDEGTKKFDIMLHKIAFASIKTLFNNTNAIEREENKIEIITLPNGQVLQIPQNISSTIRNQIISEARSYSEKELKNIESVKKAFVKAPDELFEMDKIVDPQMGRIPPMFAYSGGDKFLEELHTLDTLSQIKNNSKLKVKK